MAEAMLCEFRRDMKSDKGKTADNLKSQMNVRKKHVEKDLRKLNETSLVDFHLFFQGSWIW